MVKLKDLLNEIKKTPYIAHKTNVSEVEPAIFDNQKRLNVYKKGDTFEYINKKTKKSLGLFKAIDNVKPIDGANLSPAEKKKKAEVFSQIRGTTVKHFLRVKRIG